MKMLNSRRTMLVTAIRPFGQALSAVAAYLPGHRPQAALGNMG